LKQARGVEKVAEASELVFDGSFEWVAARTGWGTGAGIQVVHAWNQFLGASGASSRLRLCQTHRQGQNHHQRHQTFAPSHFFLSFFPLQRLILSVGKLDFSVCGLWISFALSVFYRSVPFGVRFVR